MATLIDSTVLGYPCFQMQEHGVRSYYDILKFFRKESYAILVSQSILHDA